jgi:hypothetical protein
MEEGNAQLGASHTRSLSYTEATTAFTCFAQHDYRYEGRLAGDCLRPRQVAAALSDGRAWGAAVAAWHASRAPFDLFVDGSAAAARWAAHEAARASFDATQTWDLERLVEHEDRVGAMLDHYMHTAEKLTSLTRLEGEFDVPIPSRTGRRASNRFRFTGFLDGFTVDEHEHEWLVEFKLRRQLQRAELIQLSRQVHWYAWARQAETGRAVVGVIVDERLNEAPKPARIVKGRKSGQVAPSHAKDQMTTAESYIAVCQELGEDAHEDTIAALGARQWQKRTPIMFGPGELEEAGQELVSAARLIAMLDAGELHPVRNASAAHCNGCDFRPICSNPHDALYVDTLFERVPPKRLRGHSSATTLSEPAADITMRDAGERHPSGSSARSSNPFTAEPQGALL